MSRIKIKTLLKKIFKLKILLKKSLLKLIIKDKTLKKNQYIAKEIKIEERFHSRKNKNLVKKKLIRQH